MSLTALARPLADFDRISRRESEEKTALVRRFASSVGWQAPALAAVLRTSAYEAALLMNGISRIQAGSEQFRNALRLIRLSAALHSMFDCDSEAKLAWLADHDDELGAAPWNVMVGSEDGFEEVVDVASARAQATSRPGPR